MPHNSIAVIRKLAEDSSNQISFEYLVLQRPDKIPFFFETQDKAIGATFRLSVFIEILYGFFGFTKQGKTAGSSFQRPPRLFRSSPKEPSATSYMFELTPAQIERIAENISLNTHPDLTITWMTESALNSIRNQWSPQQSFIFKSEQPFSHPEFTNEFRANLAKIVEAKNNGKLVIFAGAGISADSGALDWKELTDSLKADLETNSDKFLEIAQLYYDKRQHKEYYDKIVELLRYGKTQYNPNHAKITDLKPVHIVTTNYDDHFEQVILQKALTYSTVRQDIDFPFAKGSSLYVKMHGDLGIKRIVLKKNDYENYAKDFPLILSFIQETFASKLVLFLGFSFSDNNLDKITDDVKDILKANVQPPYIFTGNLDSEEKREKWKKIEDRGFRVLGSNEALNIYYQQIELQEDVENVAKLSGRGKDVYKFLRVLEEFDPIADRMDKLHMDALLFRALQRFDDINAIPIHTLTQITPFKLNKHPNYDQGANAEYNEYLPYTLQTSNGDLLEFLKERQGESDRVTFSSHPDPTLPVDEQNTQKALRRIYVSGIRYIARKNDTTAESYWIKPTHAQNNCKCLRCLIRRLEFRNVLSAFSNREARALCEQNYLDEKLLEAYAYYKTGQPVRAFHALDNAAQQALRQFNYINYFISVLNQVELYNRVKYRHEIEIDSEQVDRILEKITRIDKYDILTRLPVESIVRECLQYILENRIYHDNLSLIKKELAEIKENYKKHKKEGYNVSGPVVWFNLEAKVYLIWNFYYQNLLFKDETTEFWSITEYYVEAIVASYATSPRYKQRLTSIWPFFNHLATQYTTTDFLKKVLKDYKIEFFAQASKDDSVLTRFHSLLDAGYDQSTFLGETIKRNPLFDGMVNSSSVYEANVVRMFSNNLILLCHIELTDDDLNTTIDKVIYFITVSEAFAWSGALKPFTTFVERYVHRIDEVRLKKLLSFSLLDHIWSGPVIFALSKAMVNAGKKDLIVADFLESIRARLIEKREWPLSQKDTFALFPLMTKECKQDFMTTIVGDRKRITIDTEILKVGNKYGLWDPINDEDLFEPFFDSVINSAQNFPKYKIRNDGYPTGTNFQPWADMYFAVRMLYKYNLRNTELAARLHTTAKPRFLKWIIKPDLFDYTKFKLKWILTFSDPDILKSVRENKTIIEAVHIKLASEYNPAVHKLFTGKN